MFALMKVTDLSTLLIKEIICLPTVYSSTHQKFIELNVCMIATMAKMWVLASEEAW